MNWPPHGSNPHYIYEAMNIPKPERLIDLSANINPLGPPSVIKEKWVEFFDRIGDYPDPHVRSLKVMIAEQEGIAKERIMIGNGGAELITLIGRLFSGKNVLIIQPSFNEYEKACLANNCQVYYYHLKENWELDIESLNLEGIDAVFLCNPNNPTGVCFPFSTISQLVEACKEKGIYLVVDEAFYDFWQGYQSLVPLLETYENIILLRSMTKMFAIPGLRLGYLLAHEPIIQAMSKFQPHWSVNSIAMMVGEECLKEKGFIEQTIDYIHKEREKLFSFFKRNGFVVSPSGTNFYLLKDAELEDQLPLFEFLLRHGIVPRHTMNFPGLEGRWLRFAIKRTEENERFLEVLKEWRT